MPAPNHLITGAGYYYPLSEAFMFKKNGFGCMPELTVMAGGCRMGISHGYEQTMYSQHPNPNRADANLFANLVNIRGGRGCVRK